MTPVALPDNRIFVVFRRLDRPGLWAGLARIGGETWLTEDLTELWNGATRAGPVDAGDSAGMVEAFQNLRFGAPSAVAQSDGSVFVVFWAYEECVSVIRWLKITIS